MFLARRRLDLQSTVRWLCKRLKDPDVQAWHQLLKMARYMKGTKDMATFYLAEGPVTHIAGYLDGDWACDDIDGKSVGSRGHGRRMPNAFAFEGNGGARLEQRGVRDHLDVGGLEGLLAAAV